MKTAKDYQGVRHVRYYPETMTCLACGSKLHADHAVWRKYITTLTEVVHVTNVGCYCSNSKCPRPHRIYRSAAADALSVRAFSFGMDVLALVGDLRWNHQRTRQEIHAHLQQRGVGICECEVQHLYETYAVLLHQSVAERLVERREQMQANGGMIISLDGIQPEKGNECLWVVREVLTGTILAAQNLTMSDTAALRDLLQPIAASGVPLLGIVSDGFKPIRLAVAALWPDVPHQICHFHLLRDIAMPTMTADRHLKTALKKSLRGIGAVEQHLGTSTAAQVAVVRGYTQAMRALLLEDGRPPLDLPGVKIYEGLEAIAHSLEHSQEKRGIPISPDC